MLSLGDLDGAMSFQWAPSSVVQYRCCPLCAQPTCGVSSFIDCTCCADATGNNTPTNNARTIMLSVLFTGEASLVSSANRARAGQGTRDCCRKGWASTRVLPPGDRRSLTENHERLPHDVQQSAACGEG